MTAEMGTAALGTSEVIDIAEAPVLGEQLNVTERLVLAPATGRFRMAPAQHFTTEGEYVLEGQVVGSIETSAGEPTEVRTPFRGWVMGFLVGDGYPVHAGDAVLWLWKL